MNTPQWAWELARAFWRDAGPAPPFPRRLRPAIDRSTLLVAVEELPRLTPRLVCAHLAKRGVEWEGEGSRRLRGALIAHGEVGWVFLDADDPDDEREFSLAHELAHFLRHVWQPRRRAEALGAADAFDGTRLAGHAERVAALLRGVRLAPYAHLRERDGDVLSPEARRAEEEADVLALELLAPEDALPDGADADRLSATFGLPTRVARWAAGRGDEAGGPTPVSDRLKKVLSRRRTPGADGEQVGGR